MSRRDPFWLRFLLWIDQGGNILGGEYLWGPYAGDEDETISSCLGKLKLSNGGTIPWKYPVAKIVDWGLERIDPNHSIDAIEHDEGVRVD